MKTVCLETARKLAESGCPQESERYYLKLDSWREVKLVSKETWSDLRLLEHVDHKRLAEYDYSAYCACELLEQLPKIIYVSCSNSSNSFHLYIDANNLYDWTVGYTSYHHNNNVSLAEACAELWLWCKKEGYIK